MATDTHEVNKTDLGRIFSEIRKDVEKAASREDLTELYKRTGYLIMMTHVSPVKEKLGGTMKIERGLAEREFARTVRKINSRAKEIGIEADFNENWEGLATNGYEAEEENLLEADNDLIKK
jgi:hypothetical protein